MLRRAFGVSKQGQGVTHISPLVRFGLLGKKARATDLVILLHSNLATARGVKHVKEGHGVLKSERDMCIVSGAVSGWDGTGPGGE